ncbi:DUF5060 domain-containing protein [Mucilaginibacter sp.]|uniref:DUF5060 domain-containing protein n=1 Tax=Mucilaginibacter sp. TaxID=1882438 RepID=UPI003D0A20EE
MKIILYALLLIALLPFGLKGQIRVSVDSSVVSINNVYEITINHSKAYPNNWEDVNVVTTFTGPENIIVNGFFYDAYTWKVRFAPPKEGLWRYSISFKTPTSTFTDTGTFNCTSSIHQEKGYLKQHPSNKFRLVFADGTLFNGVAFEDCVLDFNNDGTPLNDFGLDGEFYPVNTIGRRVKLDTYMETYGSKGAGFNLFRWTTDNCSFKLYNNISTSGNDYSIQNGRFGDTLIRSLKANKIRIWLTFFGPPVFGNITSDMPLEEAAIKRYINYVIARYGAYTDIWELFNESSASDYYYETITKYIRSIDSFKRLISVSDERPQLSSIDINSPHWYQKESEFESDMVTNKMISSRKTYKKLIIFGEQGNSVQNWDALSSLRMRIRSWTSFFCEGILIFWNTSYAKNYFQAKSANIYLGPQERSYIRSLQDFTAFADSSVIQSPINPLNPSDVRAYGLDGKNMIFGYFHHYSSHTDSISTSFRYRLKRSGIVFWINPADNKIIDSMRLSFGSQRIVSPKFAIDLAMRIQLDSVNSVFDIKDKLDLLIYPNPATTEIAVSGNFIGPAEIDIYDVNGKKVFINRQIFSDQFFHIDGLAPGVYIYSIKVNNRIGSGKLIIK